MSSASASASASADSTPVFAKGGGLRATRSQANEIARQLANLDAEDEEEEEEEGRFPVADNMPRAEAAREARASKTKASAAWQRDAPKKRKSAASSAPAASSSPKASAPSAASWARRHKRARDEARNGRSCVKTHKGRYEIVNAGRGEYRQRVQLPDFKSVNCLRMGTDYATFPFPALVDNAAVDLKFHSGDAHFAACWFVEGLQPEEALTAEYCSELFANEGDSELSFYKYILQMEGEGAEHQQQLDNA
jgi:hypothetical protein